MGYQIQLYPIRRSVLSVIFVKLWRVFLVIISIIAQETRLGKYVNDIRRKSADAELPRRLKSLVKKWRDSCQSEQNGLPPKAPGGSNGVSPQPPSSTSPPTPCLTPPVIPALDPVPRHEAANKRLRKDIEELPRLTDHQQKRPRSDDIQELPNPKKVKMNGYDEDNSSIISANSPIEIVEIVEEVSVPPKQPPVVNTTTKSTRKPGRKKKDQVKETDTLREKMKAATEAKVILITDCNSK